MADENLSIWSLRWTPAGCGSICLPNWFRSAAASSGRQRPRPPGHDTQVPARKRPRRLRWNRPYQWDSPHCAAGCHTLGCDPAGPLAFGTAGHAEAGWPGRPLDPDPDPDPDRIVPLGGRPVVVAHWPPSKPCRASAERLRRKQDPAPRHNLAALRYSAPDPAAGSSRPDGSRTDVPPHRREAATLRAVAVSRETATALSALSAEAGYPADQWSAFGEVCPR